MTDYQKDEPWHLSKSIPISLVVGLLLQAGVFIWTVSSMSSDITSNRESLRGLENDVNVLEIRVHDTDVKIGRIEENIRHIGETLDSINETLKNLQ